MMPQPLNPTDDADPTPNSAPRSDPAGPGQGGDARGERQSLVPDTKDEVHGKKPASGELDGKGALGTPLGGVKTMKEKSLDHSKQDGAETHRQEVTHGEKETSAASVGEVRGTDTSSDAEVYNSTGSTTRLNGSDHDTSETKGDSETTQHESKMDINAENEGSIQALLKRDLHHLSRPERSILYHEGVKQREGGHLEGALKCFLGAITGLSEGSSFKELPKCLHAISDAYFEQKRIADEKAVYFIQAEKMYYETALIDIVSTEKDAGSKAERTPSKEDGEEDDEQLNEKAEEESRQDDSNNPDDDLSPDAKKGQEFENLARLCLKEGKLQLALDYCGKATKMYQTVYGEEHPVTVAALDLFTVIYADVGKKLYSDAMQKFEKEEEALKSEKSHDSMSPDSTAPGLRQRFTNSDSKEVNGVDEIITNERMIHQGELEPTTLEERDDWVITVLLMLIFFLATVFIVIVISSIYCYNNNRTGYCTQTRGDINYWYMYVRHLIHDIRKRFR